MHVAMPETMDAVILERDGAWIGVFLDHYLVAQAKTKSALVEELQRVLTAYITISLENGQEPFAKMQKAPERYWRQFPASEKPEATIMYRLPERSSRFAGESSLILHRLQAA